MTTYATITDPYAELQRLEALHAHYQDHARTQADLAAAEQRAGNTSAAWVAREAAREATYHALNIRRRLNDLQARMRREGLTW